MPNARIQNAPRATDMWTGRRLEYFTLGWNLTEALVGISAGVITGSIALIGFGMGLDY